MSDLISGQPDGSTPLQDVSGLKLPRIKTRNDLFIAEFNNIRPVIVKYLASRPSKRRAPFSFTWLFKLHEEMFGEVWTWAGKTRNETLNIGDPVHLIETNLLQLAEDIAYWGEHESMEPFEQAVQIHHRAVKIHPFVNGNGRWSRMLANIRLVQYRLSPTVWPEQTIGETSIIRAEYLAAIRAADNYDMEPLRALHRRYTPGVS
jgi:Fic-DOC domain mobile mystery protein B